MEKIKETIERFKQCPHFKVFSTNIGELTERDGRIIKVGFIEFVDIRGNAFLYFSTLHEIKNILNVSDFEIQGRPQRPITYTLSFNHENFLD